MQADYKLIDPKLVNPNKIQDLPQNINPPGGNIKWPIGDPEAGGRARTEMSPNENAEPTVSGSLPTQNEYHMDVEMLITTMFEKSDFKYDDEPSFDKEYTDLIRFLTLQK